MRHGGIAKHLQGLGEPYTPVGEGRRGEGGGYRVENSILL
jgi:hypothetical protein